MESSKGELISIFVGESSSSSSTSIIRVFKFNENLRLWQSLHSLGDQAAFLSHPSSIILSCHELQINGFENTIQLPRFFDQDMEHNVFYSLSTRKFHSFKLGGYTSSHLHPTERWLNCAWIVPMFKRHYRRDIVWVDPPPEYDTVYLVHPCWAIRYYLELSEKVVVGPARRRHQELPRGGSRPCIILSRNNNYTLVNLANTSTSTSSLHMEASIRTSSSLRGKLVYGSAFGKLLLLVDVKSGDCGILDLDTMDTVGLPRLKMPRNFVKSCCVIDGKCFLVAVFGRIIEAGEDTHTSIMGFWRAGDDEWTIHIGGPQVCSAVSYKGKIYGVTQMIGGRRRLIELEQPEAWQIHGDNNHFAGMPKLLLTHKPTGSVANTKYLVESCGQILMFVEFLSRRRSGTVEVIMDVRAYRLDMKKLRWYGLDDLGDRAFVLDPELGGFEFGCASTSGVPRGSLYFVRRFDANSSVVRYNYENHTTSVVFTCSSRDHDQVEGASVHGIVFI
ncbi:hypothetical protein LINGRAPRIM_LOCUS3069 [Linum grandiflorum]